MNHDLIKLKGALYCRQCKQSWGANEHHLSRLTECIALPSVAPEDRLETLGARLIDRWQRETGQK